MGQKTNPIGFRLGITKPWRSTWYAKKDMPALLKEDALLRKYLKARLDNAAISDVPADMMTEAQKLITRASLAAETLVRKEQNFVSAVARQLMASRAIWIMRSKEMCGPRTSPAITTRLVVHRVSAATRIA